MRFRWNWILFWLFFNRAAIVNSNAPFSLRTIYSIFLFFPSRKYLKKSQIINLKSEFIMQLHKGFGSIVCLIANAFAYKFKICIFRIHRSPNSWLRDKSLKVRWRKLIGAASLCKFKITFNNCCSGRSLHLF